MFGFVRRKTPEEEELPSWELRMVDASFEEEEGVPCMVEKTLSFFSNEYDSFEEITSPSGTFSGFDYSISLKHHEKDVVIFLAPLRFDHHPNVYLYSTISIKGAMFRINHESAKRFKFTYDRKVQENWQKQRDEKEQEKKQVLKDMGCL